MRWGMLVALLAVWPSTGGGQSDDTWAITGAVVVDGSGAAPRKATVVVRGERIVAVGPSVIVPAGARVIPANGQTLLPGLFDLHTHLPYATVAGVTGDWAKHLAAYLHSGVTSVVDFGTDPETFEPMRRLLASGAVRGPRISLAARLSTPGGHGAEGTRRDITTEVSTPREARAAVRRLLAYRPDVLKVFTDGWRYGLNSDMTSMQEDTLTALVEEAHRNGLKVLSHTVTLDKAKVAARAGVDVIAHGVGDAAGDDELVRLLREKGTTYAPTLAVYEPRKRELLPPTLARLLDPAVRAGAAWTEADAVPLARPDDTGLPAARRARWGRLLGNSAALQRGGTRHGVGTDAGVTGAHHGWATLRELHLLVQAGLTPLEALTAATGNSAKALGVDAERGLVAEGRLADLVLVEGAPHERIGDLERMSRVWVGGREVDRAGLARLIAEPGLAMLPSLQAQERIADCERPDSRTSLDTLPVLHTDGGVDHTQALAGRVRRGETGHALSVTSRMSQAECPWVQLGLPLSRGAVEPADANRFQGIEFDIRGEGPYRLLLVRRGVRDGAHFQAPFEGASE